MEYIMVWVLIFAGATIGLLVTFLMASERELRAQEELERNRTSRDFGAETAGIGRETTNSPVSAEEDDRLPAALDEIARLRQDLAQAQQELETHRRLSERWHQVREKLSGIMGKQAALSTAENEIQDDLLGLATLMLDQSEGTVVTPRSDFQSAPLNDQASDTAGSRLISPTNEPGEASYKKRNGALLMGIIAVIGALGSQAWRLTAGRKSDSVDAAPPARIVREEVVHQDANTSVPAESQIENKEAPATEQKGPVTTESRPETAAPAKRIDTVPSRALLAQDVREQFSAPLKSDVLNNGSVRTYAAIQPGHVYTRPDENSPAVGEIETGMEILVVNAEQGWLEVRSRNGRAPGYVRSEIAVPENVQH